MLTSPKDLEEKEKSQESFCFAHSCSTREQSGKQILWVPFLAFSKDVFKIFTSCGRKHRVSHLSTCHILI